MDGTLLTPDKRISAECMAAIGEAKAAGKMVLLCSGRSPSELREYMEILPEVRWLCTTAGALLYDAQEKKILEMHPFDQRTAEELVDLLTKRMDEGTLDLVATFGAGNIDRYVQPIAQMIKERI